jgi:hypothetical protein
LIKNDTKVPFGFSIFKKSVYSKIHSSIYRFFRWFLLAFSSLLPQSGGSIDMSLNTSPVHAESVTKTVKIPAAAISGKIGMLKAAYWRTQRLLDLSEMKLTHLENNPDILEAMPIREFRTLSKSVLDLQKELLHYADLIEEEENRPALVNELVKGAVPVNNQNAGSQYGKIEAGKTPAIPPGHPIFGKNHGKKR